MKAKTKFSTAMVAGLSLLISSTAVFGAASGNQEQRGQLSEKDYQFVMDAARGGMDEIQSGDLAHKKGINQTVKSFGERMVTDHTKLDTQLKQLAEKKKAVLPTAISAEEKTGLSHLKAVSGKTFDQGYAEDMVRDHEKDIKAFQTAAKEATDPELRAFANKALPTLQEHLRLAKEMEAAVKNEK